ncbi:MAG: HAD family hydrolase [Parcubacteria group bacterium]|nr:HAD family hydrolase [Parcubacteria group bacterium]
MITPRCIIFDADGVTFNSIDTHARMRKELAAIFNVTPEQLDYKGGEALRALTATFDKKTVKKYIALWDQKELEYGLRPVNKLNETLGYLKTKGIALGILTNRFTRFGILEVFKASGLDFSKIDFFVNHDPRPTITKIKFLFGWLQKLHANHLLNKYPKPDPRAIAPALNFLKNLDGFPNSVYYIGDNLIDLEFARANGFGFVGVLSGNVKDPKEWRLAGADAVIKDISELPRILGA